MCVGSPTVGTSSSSESPPDDEFETHSLSAERDNINRDSKYQIFSKHSLNSKIMSIKREAGGFRNFTTAIYFQADAWIYTHANSGWFQLSCVRCVTIRQRRDLKSYREVSRQTTRSSPRLDVVVVRLS